MVFGFGLILGIIGVGVLIRYKRAVRNSKEDFNERQEKYKKMI